MITVFLGFLYCEECDSFIKAIQQGNKTYRSKNIEAHFATQSHKDFINKKENEKWAVFQPIMREKIILQWVQMLIQNGVPYKTFEKDQPLMEAAALLIESQTGEVIDRNSLKQIFPDRRQMALRIPEMKRRIDGKSIICFSNFAKNTVF